MENFRALIILETFSNWHYLEDNFRRRRWHPTPVLLPGKSHGWRSLVGCSPWGHEELDTTERLAFHFSLSCIGEGNGNPLQCSCLENPGDGGAWWATVYGVTHSRTRLKWLSSSSSPYLIKKSILLQNFSCEKVHYKIPSPLNVSVQFSPVAQLCLTLRVVPMDCSTPGLPVHHQLPEFTQTYVR